MVPYGLSWHRHHPKIYQDLTVFFFGAERVGDVPHVLHFFVFLGVSFSPFCSALVQEKTPQPPPLNRGSLGHSCARQRRGVSCEGKYQFSIPQCGGGGVYTGVFVEHSPSRCAPWGWAIDNEWWSIVYSHSGRPPHGPLPPFYLPNGENTKAWDWIANDNSDPNEWSHSWAMRKSIGLMKKTIIDDGNSGKIPLSLEREKIALKG